MFQIVRIQKGQRKVLKNAINMRPLSFDNAEDAQKFSASMIANFRADWKSEGRKAPTFEIIVASS